LAAKDIAKRSISRPLWSEEIVKDRILKTGKTGRGYQAMPPGYSIRGSNIQDGFGG